MTAPAAPVRGPWRGWWPGPFRQTRAEAAWLVVAGVLSPIALVVVLTGLVVGLALSPLGLGLLVLAGVVRSMRLFGGVHRRLAGALLDTPLRAPAPMRLRPGLGHWLAARLGDRPAWRAGSYLVLRVPLSFAGFAVAGSLLVFGAAGAIYPVLWFFTRDVLPVYNIFSRTWPGTVLWAVGGVLALGAVPWVVHSLAYVDRQLARLLLSGPGLRQRLRFLEETRATALEDAAQQLRRIERDLHDGAQAQLVAMAMKLGLAKEELAAGSVDLDQVRMLVDAAHGNAKQALVELRDLARGIHPAALDKGLDVALSTVAGSAGMAATVSVRLSRRPPPSLETVVYFAAAELMTNVAKHSGKPCAVAIDDHDGVLRLTVTDAGPGGAAVVPGGGLAGIAERLRPVDGELTVSSPPGGPTRVTAEVPLPH
ncbi:sensor domain-containing protein [Amycolatopsis rhabdoformis]|uniref:histidine kinase n=1 Tax=Amycolatopsis rhabdoformis TaxID=1448059 RepID=A0ABZ1I8I9_9PSEU|nr:sensor domain-containing protein [Amycolatopsis rhabdoformis]WSE30489.1 sensor domain-containing protein [Amycolatopsis rhabdoformis]